MSLRTLSWLAASLCVFGWLAAGSARAAVSISSFSLVPSSAQAGGAPEVRIDLKLTNSGTDTLQAATLSLASGLLADPSAASVCSAADYAAQQCPSSSQVGSGTITGYAPSFGTSVALPTRMYLIQPAGSAIAEIGLVADFYDYPAADVRAPVTVRASPTVGLDIAMTGIPDQFDDGGTEIPIQVQEIDLTLAGSVDGRPFTRLPTGCGTAASTISLTSYGSPSTPVSASSSFAPSGCDALGFAPSVAGTAARDSGDDGVAFSGAVLQRAGDSAVSQLTLTLPSGLAPRLSAVGAACPAGDLSGCEPIGSARVTSPLLAAPVDGELYLVSSGSLLPDIDAVFPSPLGLTLQGSTALSDGQVSATFAGLPDVPLDRLDVAFSGGPSSLLTAGSGLCSNAQTLSGSLVAQNGATASATAAVTVVGCPTGTPGASGSVSGGGSGSGSTGGSSGAAGGGGARGAGGSGAGSDSGASRPRATVVVHGLVGRHPYLKLTVAAGRAESALTQLSLTLPAGLRVAASRSLRGVRAWGGGHRLRGGVTLLGRRASGRRRSSACGLSLGLPRDARQATVQVSYPALIVTRALTTRLRRHHRVMAPVTVTVRDARGHRFVLRLRVRLS